MRNTGFSHIIAAIFLLIIPGISHGADLRDDAIAAERRGDPSGARALYISWLSSNYAHTAASDVLLHSASLHDSATEALSLMASHVDELPPSAAHSVYARMASLETILGFPAEAALHYEKAASVGGEAGQTWAFEALVMRYGMGEYEYVSRKAGMFHATAVSPSYKADFLALQAGSIAMTGQPEEALDMINSLLGDATMTVTPLLWLVYGDIAVLLGDGEGVGRARSGLDAMYPESVDGYLLANRIHRWVSPELIISDNPVKATISAIQTGAFSTREAAASLRHSLEDDGFTAWIEKSGRFWRVYVNDADGKAGDRLEASGYEFSLSS